MPYQQHILDNSADVLKAVRSTLVSYCAEGGIPVLLLPTSEAVLRFSRALSDDSCRLGVRIETFNSWIKDRWQLFGDGRHIVELRERELLLYQACDDTTLKPTPGVLDVLARLVSEALPDLTGVDSVRADEAGLSTAEREVLHICDVYANLLAGASLCEVSQAATLLPAAFEAASEHPPVVLAGFDDLNFLQQKLVNALASFGEVLRFDDGCRLASAESKRAEELESLLNHLGDAEGAYTQPVTPTGAVRFLLPAGRYAAPRLISEQVGQLVSEERARAQALEQSPLPIALVAHDPQALFDDIADDLLLQGVSAAHSGYQTFETTPIGRAFLSLLAFMFDESHSIAQISDFLLSPFSGIDYTRACELDALWRGDRLVNFDKMKADISAKNSVAAAAIKAIERNAIDEALALLGSEINRQVYFDGAYRMEQVHALKAARAFSETCSKLGTSLVEQRTLLAQIRVPLTERSVPKDKFRSKQRPDVLFLAQSEAADLAMCSCAAVVMCDLTADDYPVRAVEDAGTLLFEKLGFAQPADALRGARRIFFRAISCACHTLVCERVLKTVDAEDAYPAVMFEELLDCYRSFDAGVNNDDQATGLPPCLVPFALTAGEEKLHRNLSLGDQALRPPQDQQKPDQQKQDHHKPDQQKQLAGQSWDLPQSGIVSPELKSSIMAGVALSASAIESYLECPYEWFAKRRLKLDELDAGFGPLEMGDFAHHVFKSFYEEFQAGGNARVTADNLSEARTLMSEVFEREYACQTDHKKNSNALIACTPVEEREVDDLKQKLVGFLDFDATLLPTFTPTFFEYDFGSDEPFLYANYPLLGKIDRIDVNEKGQAVIIDYKGTLSEHYSLKEASSLPQAHDALMPHKVQALIYAQVARRLLELDVVGAIYVCYGRAHKIFGAYDATVLGQEVLPGVNSKNSGVPDEAAKGMGITSFTQLLDTVEEGVDAAIRSLNAGEIAPCPHGEDACTFCPVLSCEKRGRS